MVRWQTVTQAYCQIQRLVIVHGFKASFHAHSLPLLTSWRLLLSDKLLEGAFMFPADGAARLANSFILSQQIGYRFIRRERAAERQVASGFSARHLAYRWRGSERA